MPVVAEGAVSAKEYTVMTVGGNGVRDVVVLPSPRVNKLQKVKKRQSTSALKPDLVSQSTYVTQAVATQPPELITPPTNLTQVAATAIEPKRDLETKPAPTVVADDPFRQGKIATDFFLAGIYTFLYLSSKSFFHSVVYFFYTMQSTATQLRFAG